MKRNKLIDICTHEKLGQHKQCIAFHEAGHAVAIYLNNKARNLPPVFFQIIFNYSGNVSDYDGLGFESIHDDSVARIEGGRLIQSFHPEVDGLVNELVEKNETIMPLVEDYINAFEADIINLLVGPLAEAKFVYNRDDEWFSYEMLNLNSLKNYGGDSDLALVREYVESLSKSKLLQNIKMDELFAIAFQFVNDASNWKAITKLADFILQSNKNIISCEDVVSLLDG
jgi:hypothetical protein